jgi:hypothetical protein
MSAILLAQDDPAIEDILKNRLPLPPPARSKKN